ncbi:hypothetical protein BCR35DRAFT_27599 [Leucosporidium creatinivorum]|uniref:Uncharacterized protein n=1 Tax=Leucosporidium creatinivorum TaxID=106004 RepID=A0A1Y2CM40_9BASI|nr:hypothetical protein BCR35DRAFT_27599 [Leucosporidium creatinivorum]
MRTIAKLRAPKPCSFLDRFSVQQPRLQDERNKWKPKPIKIVNLEQRTPSFRTKGIAELPLSSFGSPARLLRHHTRPIYPLPSPSFQPSPPAQPIRQPTHPAPAPAPSLARSRKLPPVAANSPYLHPNTSPHLPHAISLTVCSPVVMGRSSGGPVVMFTLGRERRARGGGGEGGEARGERVREGEGTRGRRVSAADLYSTLRPGKLVV